jgi:transcriptional regulator with XRE-family HTH domain
VSGSVHDYGAHFRRVRLEAADRLGLDELRTVAGASRYLGIGQSTLYHYEDGTKRPSLEQLEEIARGYGVLAGDMLPSSTPRGPLADRVLGPIATLPPMVQERFIAQISGLARLFAAEMSNASTVATFAVANETVNGETDSRSGTYPAANGNTGGRTDQPGIAQHLLTDAPTPETRDAHSRRQLPTAQSHRSRKT